MVEIQKLDARWQFDKAYEECGWDNKKFEDAVEKTVNGLDDVVEKRKLWKQYNAWATELRRDGNETAAKVIQAKIEKFIADMAKIKTAAEAEKLGSEYTAFFEDVDVKKWFIKNQASPLVAKCVKSYATFLSTMVQALLE
jgi:hypothetical protein